MSSESSITELLSLLPPSSSIWYLSPFSPTNPIPLALLSSSHKIDTSRTFSDLNSTSSTNDEEVKDDDIPPTSTNAVILLFTHHTTVKSWGDFHSAIYRFTEALIPGGYFLLGNEILGLDGQGAGEGEEGGGGGEEEWDESETYFFENENFKGKEGKGRFGLSEDGARNVFESMGLEIVYDEVIEGQGEREEEELQYVIARRKNGETLKAPLPLPTQ